MIKRRICTKENINKIIYYFLLGKKESIILYDYMYSNATFYLKRKKDRMDIIIKTTPRKSK